MGNRRKILAAVFGVLLLAVGTVSGALLAFKPRTVADTPIANAATVGTSASGYTISGTGINCKSSTAITLTSGHVYYVEIAGQRGGASGYASSEGYHGLGGDGAICYGFVKATTNASGYYTAKVGWNGGMDGGGNNTDYYTNLTSNRSGAGGGYSSFSEINFALPSGYSGGTTEGIAAGGGGAGKPNTSYAARNFGGNGGYEKGYPAYLTRYTDNSFSNRYYGLTYCTQANAGPGASGTTGGRGWDPENGGGGGGYTGGSRGDYFPGKYLTLWEKAYNNGDSGCHSLPSGITADYGGSGGTSSPNLYCAQYKSNYGDDGHYGWGYVQLIDIYPTAVPTANNKTDGSAATINDGTANNPRNCQWQWSTNGGSSWTTTKPSRSEVGSQTINWRYVVTGTSPYGQYIPTSVIRSGTLTLSVTEKPGTLSAPTLTGNGSATYNASDIQVVTAAGQSSGTFTFATKERDENDA